jgi:LuxR family transcriptional regulator, maltose regulon positive regulatory protein
VADAELAAIAAGRRADHGWPEAAEKCLRLAERGGGVGAGHRRAQADLLLGIAGLLLARQRGDLPAVAERAQRKQDAAEAAQPGLGDEVRVRWHCRA